MENKIWNVTQYNFSQNDELLLDTNIWLLLYGPQGKSHSSKDIYSEAFARILKAKSRIYIDMLIISEFINTYARTKWKQVASQEKTFKEFRNSTVFKPIAEDVAADVQQVLKHCSRISIDFESLNINGLINEYAGGKSDFNDQILVLLCEKNGLKLITNDGDFHQYEIPVVTANKKLLGCKHV
ncbi:MAG: PIN domain-containing protein [Deltaproteobacteria bacterium]